jgi:uncharacterized protein
VTLLLDTSALVKLVSVEPESSVLRQAVTGRSTRLVASALVRTELRRVARRLDVPSVDVDAVLLRLALVPVDDSVLDLAGQVASLSLRSLDALHVATALRIAPVDAVVTYDTRMQEAVGRAGLDVLAPAP